MEFVLEQACFINRKRESASVDLIVSANGAETLGYLDDPSCFRLSATTLIDQVQVATLLCPFKARGFKIKCLLCYCSEGDNMSDVSYLAEAGSELLKLNPDDFHAMEVLLNKNLESVTNQKEIEFEPK